MSCQRGNTSRTRKQKYNNITAFKNNLHDSSKRTSQINSMEITDVCKRCQEVISWKVKYKKYKPLSQPKTCTMCHQKNIKDAYHTVCNACSKEFEICCKCGKKEENLIPKPPSEKERFQTMRELESKVNCLSERKRRTFYRYLKLEAEAQGKKALKTPEEDNVSITNENEKETTFSISAQKKLEELMKGMEDDTFYEDLEDLNLCSEDESIDEDESYSYMKDS